MFFFGSGFPVGGLVRFLFFFYFFLFLLGGALGLANRFSKV